MRFSVVTAEKIYVLYVKMLDVLRDELSHFPFILDDLERRVSIYKMELKGMDLMAIDMLEAMEAAKVDMTNTESELIAEKKFRENSLSIQKKQIERICMKDASERHRRMQARRDMEFPSLIIREGLRGAKLEASKAQIEYQSLVTTEVEKIKSAVQCSHLWDIAGRFMAQKKSEENLRQQIAESEKRRRDLKAHLRALELERAQLKFHQSLGFLSSKRLEEDLQKNLEEEEERLLRVRDQVSRNQELLLHFENGVDNLIMRLCDIGVPGQEGFPKTEDVFKKLQFCETKLLHLSQMTLNLPSYNFSQEDGNETFVHLRNFLEKSTREEHQNLRITFDEDEEDVRVKIVIRGDRNTGKTTLWHRLQGKKFVEEYIPTQEIQVTSIHWNYKTTDDIVKVEVWDVVDKGKCKKRGDGLKLDNDPQEAESEMALDAEFLDVYKNCNGVVMMFDITKQWTFNYILRELPKVPTHVPVCVLGNYRDMGEHRVILPDDVREFIDNLNRPPGSSYFRYAESSMKNSFGLKYLHKFFNIPFLQLQRETLLRQLETNQLDIDATLEELSVQQETEDQNYELFLEMMEARGRGHASPLATNGQSLSSGSQSPVVPPGNASGGSSPGTPQQSLASPATVMDPVEPPAPGLPPEAQPPTAVPAPAPPQKRGIIARLFGTSPAPETGPPPPDPAVPALPAAAPSKVQSIEDFVPEESLDHSFLEDPILQRDKGGIQAAKAPTDSDSDRDAPDGNPLVAGFQDDLDLDEHLSSKPPLAAELAPSKNVTLSSEEDECSKFSIKVAEDTGLEQEKKRASKKSSKLAEPSASTEAAELKPPPSQPPFEQMNSSKRSTVAGGPEACPPPAASSSKQQDSESDSEGPIATQMLSFVMDDPDFESEESESQRKRAEEFPVREDLSDISNEDAPSRSPPLAKPVVRSFRVKNEADLFGLGLEEPAPRDSSEEAADKEREKSLKEKKKKKKRTSKEEETEKTAGRKKSKPKKSKEKEEDRGEKEKRKPPKQQQQQRGRAKPSGIDELEAFLGGGAGASKQWGGGDYEEL
ncbi:rab-like protein 6 isoform 2-T2 [Liasis olivaceus]